MKKILLTKKPISIDLGILLLRLAGGGAMLTHGWPKLLKVLDGNFAFGDPLGIGEGPSLILAVFAEVLCSVLMILGLATRWAAIPLIITMAVALLIVHGPDDFGAKEKALLFLAIYLAVYFTGPGKYSLDKAIR